MIVIVYFEYPDRSTDAAHHISSKSKHDPLRIVYYSYVNANIKAETAGDHS